MIPQKVNPSVVYEPIAISQCMQDAQRHTSVHLEIKYAKEIVTQ